VAREAFRFQSPTQPRSVECRAQYRACRVVPRGRSKSASVRAATSAAIRRRKTSTPARRTFTLATQGEICTNRIWRVTSKRLTVVAEVVCATRQFVPISGCRNTPPLHRSTVRPFALSIIDARQRLLLASRGGSHGLRPTRSVLVRRRRRPDTWRRESVTPHPTLRGDLGNRRRYRRPKCSWG
jgi:hypothetical protein